MKKALMLVPVLAIGLAAADAFAVDNRIQQGINCHQISGGTAVVDWDGSIMNDSPTTAMGVLCPIVRDNTGSSPSYTQVDVLDQNPNHNPDQDVGCQIVSTNSATGSVSQGIYWGPWHQSSGANQTYQHFYHNANTSTFSMGSEAMACSIPPKFNADRSGIISYYVVE